MFLTIPDEEKYKYIPTKEDIERWKQNHIKSANELKEIEELFDFTNCTEQEIQEKQKKIDIISKENEESEKRIKEHEQQLIISFFNEIFHNKP